MREDLRIGEAAHRLGRDKETIREWVKRGLLPAHLSPTGQLLFHEADVEAARRGGRPSGPTQSKSEPAAQDTAQERARIPRWKELAPWDAEVESARAALTLDELEAQREARAEEREMDQEQKLFAEQQLAREEAQRQRLNGIKNQVIAWISIEWRPEVIEEIERFVTPERVPNWLPHWQQVEIVTTHAWALVGKLRAEKRRREEVERAKEKERADAARAESLKPIKELVSHIAAAMQPKPKPVPKPKTVSEALRQRGAAESKNR